ncbi:MAG: class I SAM-dependent methyltransferase [Leptospiraceae bacterium]|nr:class I SAM-dependent methyltransferase [Leptospiraceae bacterium]MCP5497868.1 class I SAM-dependent methyltransferase [Leptospiraceae bacterium]
MKLYSDLAEYYYDIEKTNRSFQEEIGFVNTLFQKHKVRSIVDLGCGTGEHVTALQSMGYKVIGIDSSVSMLEIAKRRFPDCHFQTGLIQGFQAKQTFDAALCIFGTFNYLVDNEDIESALIKLKQNLKPVGIAVFEIWNSYPIQQIKRKPITTVSMTKIGKTIVKRNRGFRIAAEEESKTIVEVNYIYHLDNKEIKDKHVMRVFSFSEIAQLLNKFQFQILNIYASYSMEKFKQDSLRMILVIKTPP